MSGIVFAVEELTRTHVGHLSSFILPSIVLVAVLAGLAASLMSKIILGIFRWKDSFRFTRQRLLYCTASPRHPDAIYFGDPDVGND